MEVSQASIDGMYSKMAQNGWDTFGRLKWSYCFMASQEHALELIFRKIADSKYLLESLEQADDEDGGWTMCVSMVEILPADKLFRRCDAFNDLADEYGALFDGWDVAQVA
ncbi:MULTISPECIES: ribonuclease E inhibitor RraB [Achromobacter]|uniref:ribonuclease E inhibitor RraB n=1 Tax=Achromobacter TaxID=222 RepID=UPI001CBCBDC5|nr:ribonuclease E inhibitor RraB [Achromobacter mucicolens]UAN04654.1 ribonuclease E inhibitor RraB [Achromobacter mucicolens]